MIPFFASLTFRDDMEVTRLRGNLSMAAMVATNLTALTNGGLYVFLRSCQSSNIGRKGYFEVDREKKQVQTRKRAVRKSPDYTNQMEQPISPPARTYRPASLGELNRQDSITASQIGVARPMSATESQDTPGPPRSTHVRKASYSVFPQQQQKTPALNPKPLSVLPAATYTPPTLTPSTNDEVTDEDLAQLEMDLMRHDISSLLPPPGLSGLMPGHQRNSSLGSSATVQIGLRLSNVNDMPIATPSYLQERIPTPRPTSSIYPRSMIVPRSSIAVPSPSRRSSVRIGSKVWVDPAKQLPPDPLRQLKKDLKPRDRESQMLLSPTVYSPEGTGNSVTGTMTSPSDKDARLSPWERSGSATEKRPSEWI